MRYTVPFYSHWHQWSCPPSRQLWYNQLRTSKVHLTRFFNSILKQSFLVQLKILNITKYFLRNNRKLKLYHWLNVYFAVLHKLTTMKYINNLGILTFFCAQFCAFVCLVKLSSTSISFESPWAPIFILFLSTHLLPCTFTQCFPTYGVSLQPSTLPSPCTSSNSGPADNGGDELPLAWGS